MVPLAGSSSRMRPPRSTTSTRPLLSGKAARNTGAAKPVPTRRTAKPPAATLVTVTRNGSEALARPSLTDSVTS